MKHAFVLSAVLLMTSIPAACGQAAEPVEVSEAVIPAAGEADPEAEVDGGQTANAAALREDQRGIDVASLPRSIIVDDGVLKADIRFDEAVFSLGPAIAADVVDDAQVRLKAMQEDAEAYKEADPDYFRPYDLKIDWRVSGAAGQLASLEGFVYTYTGGAHGNYMTDGRIYDAKTGDRMRIGELFMDKDAAAAALADTVYDAIAKAKTERNSSIGGYDMFLGESKDALSVSDILAGNVSLVASTEKGKLGGFVLHYAPYEIGSYAEGAYHVTVPEADFRAFLKPEYRPLFAGTPAEIKRAGN